MLSIDTINQHSLMRCQYEMLLITKGLGLNVECNIAECNMEGIIIKDCQEEWKNQ